MNTQKRVRKSDKEYQYTGRHSRQSSRRGGLTEGDWAVLVIAGLALILIALIKSHGFYL